MFSKILALGLAALTLVHAAPSMEALKVSCSVDLSTSVRTPTFTKFGAIEPGNYFIVNVKTGTALINHGIGPIVVSDSPKSAGNLGKWRVELAESSSAYKILNLVGAPTFVDSDQGRVFCGRRSGPSDPFTITSAGHDAFFISVASDSEIVWTTVHVDIGNSPVMVKGRNGSPEQLWRFVPVEEDDD
ncbi:hypothetical protein FB451DRAFT_64047 [Mycena latifolia]|nr:hypothetical protein FB451DRAFT_64047 [Mycena latifolia]